MSHLSVVPDQPELPYGGESHPNSGHAGSSTSRERAEHEDASGTTADRQAAVLDMLAESKEVGTTVVVVRDHLGIHHGKASSALSVLHKAGRIERLSETRGRCKVYVLPQYVNGRQTEPMGETATTTLLRDVIEELRTNSPCMEHLSIEAPVHPNCRPCRITTLLKRAEARGL